jgi:ABC-type Mn2+/Zn2+ transport system permease subunit
MSEPSFLQAVAESPLLQRAAVAGALAGLACAALSPLVVLRRMAFIGDGVAHSAFGGMGLALFLLTGSRYGDLSVQLLTLGFCLVVGLAIGIASRNGEAGRITEDSAIGVAFAVSMALGALFLALRQRRDPQYVASLDQFLFGSLLNIGTTELVMLAVVAIAAIAILLLFQKEILFYAFDARLAEASGVNVARFHYLFLLLLVLTVVVSARVVGIILVSAALVLPGVTALRLCNRLAPAMLVAALVGVVSAELGLYASYVLSCQSGAAIILIQFALLLLAVLSTSLRGGSTPQRRG